MLSDPSASRPAAYTERCQIDIGAEERKDANKEHCRAYAQAVHQRPKKYFAEFGKKQIYLSILMTHPDFRRRGAGTMLAEWGIRYAEDRSWPVTVLASPMGKLLYEHLGFITIATKVVQVKGKEVKLETTVMVLKGKSDMELGWWQAVVSRWSGR